MVTLFDRSHMVAIGSPSLWQHLPQHEFQHTHNLEVNSDVPMLSMLGCAYVNDDGLWEAFYWPGTTDPGAYYLEHPMNSAGCAILVKGQYLDTWTIDLHGGKYEALCQRAGEVSVFRDDSMDDKLDLDPSTIATGYFGINLHAATRTEHQTSTVVGKWSAGCQVHASADGFAKMMELAHQQQDKTGRKTFSYTLMDKWW